VNYRFPKSEKLKSRKAIEQLFTENKSFTHFPLKVIYLSDYQNTKNQAAFSVPKRNFKSAVERNRIKRQMREAYRLNKNIIEQKEEKKLAVLFLYLAKEKLPYATIEKAMISILGKLKSTL